MGLESGIEAVGVPGAIQVTNLCKNYRTGILRKKITALCDLSLDISVGSIFALLGPNGSGKTTLLKILTGLVRPTAGTFLIFGSPLNSALKARIGFLPDKPHHYPFLTPWETLSFDAEIFGLAGPRKKERIAEVLSLVKMERQRNLRLRYFSKGMLQRVALAQALLNDPDLLILDEPIGVLDPHGVQLLKNVIGTMKKGGKTVIFSSHLLNYAQEICEDFLVLDRGKAVYQGSLASCGGRSLADIFLGAVPP